MLPLPLNTIQIFYAKVFRELGKAISPDNIELITELTRGYPYLLQLIGYYILEYTGTSTEISNENISFAYKSAKRDMIDNIYEPVIKLLSNKDMQFLKAMSADGNNSQISMIKNRLNINDNTAQLYRKRLIDAGVIASTRRGEVEFTLPYFNEYLCDKL